MIGSKAKRVICSGLLAAVVIVPTAGPVTAAPKKAKPVKVEICHKPGTDSEGTRRISSRALKAHLGHGDTEGACTVVLPEPVV